MIKWIELAGGCVVALCIGGCASLAAERGAPTRPDVVWDQPPPARVAPAPAPVAAPPVAGPRALAEAQRFDVNVQDASARTFFMGLVRDTPFNMAVHPDVSGTITLTLADVTIPEVMELARQVYGYEYQSTRNGYVVLPARLEARVFQVDYLNLRRDGNSRTRISSGDNMRGGGGSEASAEENENNPPGSVVNTSAATDFWQELGASLNGIVGTTAGRSVVLSPQSNLVVVRAMPSELREVETYLSKVQDSMVRQVILETKIVEVTLSDDYQAGINWSALATPSSHTITIGQTGGGTLLNDLAGRSDITGQTGDLNPVSGTLPNGTLTSAFGGMFTIAAQLGDFNAFIELLKTQGDVSVLSSPRVSTVNNQKAIIKVGTEEFFVTDVSSTTVTGGGGTTSTPDVTLTPFFSGIALDVTPQISHEGEVILHIRPAVTEVLDRRKDLKVGGSDLSLPLAFSTVREADSIVRARSGQIIVIGGLMQESSRVQQSRVPGLGSIPGLGRLFRHDRNVTRKTELVILLRPIVVDSDRVWDYAVGTDARTNTAARTSP